MRTWREVRFFASQKFRLTSDKWTWGPSGRSRDREASETLSATAHFVHVRSFASRGRLQNLL